MACGRFSWLLLVIIKARCDNQTYDSPCPEDLLKCILPYEYDGVMFDGCRGQQCASETNGNGVVTSWTQCGGCVKIPQNGETCATIGCDVIMDTNDCIAAADITNHTDEFMQINYVGPTEDYPAGCFLMPAVGQNGYLAINSISRTRTTTSNYLQQICKCKSSSDTLQPSTDRSFTATVEVEVEEKEDSGGVAVLVVIIISSVCFLILFCGCLYYYCVIRRKTASVRYANKMFNKSRRSSIPFDNPRGMMKALGADMGSLLVDEADAVQQGTRFVENKNRCIDMITSVLCILVLSENTIVHIQPTEQTAVASREQDNDQSGLFRRFTSMFKGNKKPLDDTSVANMPLICTTQPEEDIAPTVDDSTSQTENILLEASSFNNIPLLGSPLSQISQCDSKAASVDSEDEEGGSESKSTDSNSDSGPTINTLNSDGENETENESNKDATPTKGQRPRGDTIQGASVLRPRRRGDGKRARSSENSISEEKELRRDYEIKDLKDQLQSLRQQLDDRDERDREREKTDESKKKLQRQKHEKEREKRFENVVKEALQPVVKVVSDLANSRRSSDVSLLEHSVLDRRLDREVDEYMNSINMKQHPLRPHSGFTNSRQQPSVPRLPVKNHNFHLSVSSITTPPHPQTPRKPRARTIVGNTPSPRYTAEQEAKLEKDIDAYMAQSSYNAS